MDLNTIQHVRVVRERAELAAMGPRTAVIGGGSWVFSLPHDHLDELLDLQGFGWEPYRETAEGLSIAATCTLAELSAMPDGDRPAHPLFFQCCTALLGSFKIWNVATVGGNLCMALPAGPMTALTAALEATCVIWASDGGERRLPVTEFVLGPQRNALRPGEILRSVIIPAAALTRRTAFRRISLSPNGRSGALLIGTRESDGAFALTVTASIRKPLRLAFAGLPDRRELARALDAAIPDDLWYDDVHGKPEWRAHMTRHLAEEIREALSDEAAA